VRQRSGFPHAAAGARTSHGILNAWGAQIRAGDVVHYPYAQFAESLVDERDLAEVAARALLTDELIGKKPELTGPETLTHEQAVAVLGDALGKPLRFAEIQPAAARHVMVERGFPEPFVEALMARYAKHARRAQHPPTGEIEKILGRPARTYAEWAAGHAEAFLG
jgi:uncharacterized protein YbjT (DUF2867 family)